MSDNFPKDDWILKTLADKYLIAMDDGTIFRRIADKVGSLYKMVKYQVHKKSGRVYFNMTRGGITKSVLVNRVIALAFLPNPLNLPQVNHIDGNKENNALANLEWATRRDNEKHAHANGLKTGRGSSNANVKLTAVQVLEIRSSDQDFVALAEKYGVSRSAIHNVRTRKTWKHV